MRLLRVVGLVVPAVLGATWMACGSDDGGGGGAGTSPDASDGDPTVVACTAGERRLGNACVAEDFFQVTFPTAADYQPIDTDDQGARYAHGVLVAMLSEPTTSLADATAIFAKYGGRVVGAIPFAGFYTVKFDAASDGAALLAKKAELVADPAVSFADRDHAFDNGSLEPPRAQSDLDKLGPTASAYTGADLAPIGANGKWAYESIGVPRAWDLLYEKNHPLEPVVVGIIDGQIDTTQFGSHVFVASQDLRIFKVEGPGSFSIRHGTAVASIIGAPNDHKGLNGILSGLSCLHYELAAMAVTEDRPDDASVPGRQLGDVLEDALFYGIVHSVQAGARVVNISMGRTADYDTRLSYAWRYRLVMSKAPDTLFVMGAGNDDQDAAFFIPCSATRQNEPVPQDGDAGSPAWKTNIENALCVSAIDESEAKAVWQVGDAAANPPIETKASNYNVSDKTVGIAAPGVRVLSQLPDGRLYMFSGTSSAAPLVSGSAALLFAILPALDGAQAKRILIDSAKPINDQTLSGKRLDIGNAVDVALTLGARLHPDRAGHGNCREADDAGVAPECPINQFCPFCTGPANGSFQLSNMDKPATFVGTSGMSISWKSDVEMGELVMGIKDAGDGGTIVQINALAGFVTSLTGLQLKGSTLDVTIMGSNLGTLYGRPLSEAKVKLDFVGDQATGTVSVKASDGSTLTTSFSAQARTNCQP